jgi:hypothetical protein
MGSVMGKLKELAALSELGREHGYTHYECTYSTLTDSHDVVGITPEGDKRLVIRLEDESRAKAVVNLLNSDIGWDESREGI